MNLFHEYQILARSPTLSPQDLERMAEIVEISSSDDELFSSIMNLEYLLAQENGLLTTSNVQQYIEHQAQLKQCIEADLLTRSANYRCRNFRTEAHM